jgi:hypothetical protein
MEMLPQVAPIFVENGKTSSSLVIVNNSAINAGATISVRGLLGAEVLNRHVSLKPHEQQEISMQSLLSGIGVPPSIGSVTVSQDSELKGLTVVSQMLITNERGTLPSYVDEELAMPAIGGSTTLRGVADDAAGDALLAVTSIVNWTQEVTLHCLAQNGESKPAIITLEAQSTALISNCSGQTVTDLGTYLSSGSQHAQHGIQGYELVTDGGIGTIAAFGLAFHSRNQDPIFSVIPFVDPARIHAANTVFAGVPFGTQAALPDGVYKPRISFTNFASSPARVTISAAITPAGAPSGSTASAVTPEKRVLQELIVAPRHSTEFAPSDIGSQGGLQQSLIIESDRNPGELLSKVVSRGDGNLFEIELLGKDQLDEDNGGSHPWHVDGDSVAHLLLFNYSDEPRVFGVRISNSAIVWDKKYKLVPYETREVSINELISDEVPDDKGRVLSPDQSSGVVNWMVPDAGEGTGRLMVTSRSRALARNFSCGQFIVVCGMTFVTSWNGVLPVNDTLALYTADPNFCDEFGPNQCYGGSSVGGGSASYSWSIGASNIVTPSSSSSYSPALYGVNPGSGYADGTATAGNCSSTGYGNPQVISCPTSISVNSQNEFQLPNSTEPTPPTLTGLGMVAGMLVSGSSGPYTGALITETVAAAGTTCQQQSWQNSACVGGDTFQVGNPLSRWGTNFASNTNIFYDTHGLISSNNLLSGTANCTISCHQTYTCGGNNIGNFTITFNLSNGSVGSYAVTQVTAGKN